mmetsp:Transcript_19550/g.63679  ORF Transcript_19550/g.63679 Transcript_19550/m.63679 type:complete len:341 (+) Transcript_19550:1090-2112(+)
MLARALRLGLVPADFRLQILALLLMHAHLVKLSLIDHTSLDQRPIEHIPLTVERCDRLPLLLLLGLHRRQLPLELHGARLGRRTLAAPLAEHRLLSPDFLLVRLAQFALPAQLSLLGVELVLPQLDVHLPPGVIRDEHLGRYGQLFQLLLHLLHLALKRIRSLELSLCHPALLPDRNLALHRQVVLGCHFRVHRLVLGHLGLDGLFRLSYLGLQFLLLGNLLGELLLLLGSLLLKSLQVGVGRFEVLIERAGPRGVSLQLFRQLLDLNSLGVALFIQLLGHLRQLLDRSLLAHGHPSSLLNQLRQVLDLALQRAYRIFSQGLLVVSRVNHLPRLFDFALE